MANLPSWAAYGRFQSKLLTCPTLDDRVWGLEGALNLILQPDFSAEHAGDADFRRAAASASRKRRDHVARFLSDLEEELDPPDTTDVLEQLVARQALNAIEQGIQEVRDASLLLGIAFGYGYGDLSRDLGEQEASLRSRALRLRRRFRHLKP